MDVWDRSLRGTVLGTAWILAVAVSSCSSGTDPADEERRIGAILGFNNDDPRIVVPDTVQAGVEFTVDVTTYGNSCFRKGETDVESLGNIATITPYDYVDLGAGFCQDILLSFVHESAVQFPDAGSASVLIVGREAGSMEEKVVEVTREVVVLSGEPSN